jgi:hypothetical protein
MSQILWNECHLGCQYQTDEPATVCKQYTVSFLYFVHCVYYQLFNLNQKMHNLFVSIYYHPYVCFGNQVIILSGCTSKNTSTDYIPLEYGSTFKDILMSRSKMVHCTSSEPSLTLRWECLWKWNHTVMGCNQCLWFFMYALWGWWLGYQNIRRGDNIYLQKSLRICRFNLYSTVYTSASICNKELKFFTGLSEIKHTLIYFLVVTKTFSIVKC